MRHGLKRATKGSRNEKILKNNESRQPQIPQRKGNRNERQGDDKAFSNLFNNCAALIGW